jgi:glycosyltransferase involved in cell wall biosynthesis
MLFAGNLGLVQGLDTVIRAAVAAKGSRVRFVFVGDGSDRARLQQLTRDLAVEDRVQFIERQPMQAMPAFMAAADALLVHLKRSELSRYVIPTKTFAYLAAGKPIVMAMEGAAADLVAEAEAGMVIPPDDPELLARTAIGMSEMSSSTLDGFGSRGASFLRTRYSKARIIGLYESLLVDVAAGRR